MKRQKIDEGLMSSMGDAIKSSVARSGMLGKTRQMTAIQDRGNDMVYKSGLASFSKLLQNSILRAYNSGVISQTPAGAPANPTAPSTAQATSPTAPTAPTTPKAPTTASAKLAPGVSVVSQEPIILKYNKADYGLDDNGKWSSLKNPARKLSQPLQAFLDKQHDISLGVNSKVSESYNYFNKLVENKINETQGIASYITGFMNGQAKKDKFVIPTTMKPLLNSLSKALEVDFLKTGAKKLNADIVRKLWDLYYTAGQQAAGGDEQNAENPTGTEPSNSDEVTKQREAWKADIVKKLQAIDINDAASFDELKSITSSLLEYLKKVPQQ